MYIAYLVSYWPVHRLTFCFVEDVGMWCTHMHEAEAWGQSPGRDADFASKIVPTWKILIKKTQWSHRQDFFFNKSNLNNGALHFCRTVYLRSWEWVRNIDEASILWDGYVCFITVLKKHKKFKPFAGVQPQNYLRAGNRVQKFSAMAYVPINNYKQGLLPFSEGSDEFLHSVSGSSGSFDFWFLTNGISDSHRYLHSSALAMALDQSLGR